MLSVETEANYFSLSSLGNFYPLDFQFDQEAFLMTLESKEESWREYNKDKPGYRRRGLSLFSLYGDDSGEIDLNSVRDYNLLTGSDLNELSFKTPTKHWSDFPQLKDALASIEHEIGRSHFLSLAEGGFFPPHRDIGNSFRLISFFNCCSESLHFILDNQKIDFQCGRLYFADTRKAHSLFSFQENAIILVFNIGLSEESVKFVLRNVREK